MTRQHCILVVEDDSELRPLLTSVLEDEGYEVVDTPSGEGALEQAKQRSFDLVVTDVRMEGIDGLQLAEALRRALPQIPIIIITGFASDDAPVRAIKQDAFDYIYKPFELADFLGSVQQALNARSLLEKIANLAKSVMFETNPERLAVSEIDRQKIFGKFFLAVRSNKVTPVEARQAWDKIEQADSQRLTGGGRYAEAEEILTAAAGKEFVALTAHESRPDFLHFYQGIKDGKVSAHELNLASFVRYLEAENLAKCSAELRELRGRLWGE
jgi:two-component system response regulator PilR (NtrC family)